MHSLETIVKLNTIAALRERMDRLTKEFRAWQITEQQAIYRIAQNVSSVAYHERDLVYLYSFLK